MQQISIINLKKKQGGVYKYNFDTLSHNVKWTREYLEGTAPLTKDQTDSYFWKFNEYLSFAAFFHHLLLLACILTLFMLI
jgi:hypothetical protein